MIFDESNVMIEKDSIFSQARLEGHTSVSQMQTWHIYYDSHHEPNGFMCM
jgi:hypothetical protein